MVVLRLTLLLLVATLGIQAYHAGSRKDVISSVQADEDGAIDLMEDHIEPEEQYLGKNTLREKPPHPPHPHDKNTTTSTTTTSTSTTTTSTSTTTTSTSTTTTSTSTTTTSTRATTTSTSITTTSTGAATTSTGAVTTSTSITTTLEPNKNQCGMYTDDQYTYIVSPNYPYDYPDNAICTVSNLVKTLGLVYVEIVDFKLKLGDTLEIFNPYAAPLLLSGYIFPLTKYLVPSAQFLAKFTSDSIYTARGFTLKLHFETTPCHQILPASPGGILESPGFPAWHPCETYCEWHIMASPGKRVNVTVTTMALGLINHLAINPTLDSFYDLATVPHVCGYFPPAKSIISDSNLMRIFMYGPWASGGFQLAYHEV